MAARVVRVAACRVRECRGRVHRVAAKVVEPGVTESVAALVA
jgi:hypothetical protein